LGLQWDYALRPDTSLTVQAVARAGEDLQPSLRMAYLEHRLGTVSARGGRMRTPLFLDTYAEEIGYANPLIRGPLPLYGAAPSQIIHLYGASLQWRMPWALGSVLIEGYYGNGRFKHVFIILLGLNHAPGPSIGFADLRGDQCGRPEHLRHHLSLDGGDRWQVVLLGQQ
jgi:hypothetical protein